MTKVIITGGAGFIGSHLVQHALKLNYEVVVIDSLCSGHLSNVNYNEDITFINASIDEPETFCDAFANADCVFHLAALVSVPESMEKPQQYFQINTLGTLNILECMRKHQVKTIVFSSTSAIYGDSPELLKTETLLPKPQSPYAISKLDGEYLLASQAKQLGIHAVSLRYFNVFGPRQDPNSAYAAAIPVFIDRALNHQDIIIYGDGEQTRDFIYINDVVLANFAATSQGSGAINVASGHAITINQLAQTIISLTGSRSKIVHQPERPGDVKHSRAINDKLIKQLGITPKTSLTKGLTSIINYLEDQDTSS